MSTLVTNTITGLSTAANITIGSTPVVSASANSLTIRGEGSAQTSVQQGLAKCWGGSTNAAVINDSLNVASSVDNGTGQYTHNLSNAMIQDTLIIQVELQLYIMTVVLQDILGLVQLFQQQNLDVLMSLLMMKITCTHL